MHLCNLSLSRHGEVRRAEVWRGLEGLGMVRRGMARYRSRSVSSRIGRVV
jgi:hypothetical protein